MNAKQSNICTKTNQIWKDLIIINHAISHLNAKQEKLLIKILQRLYEADFWNLLLLNSNIS